MTTQEILDLAFAVASSRDTPITSFNMKIVADWYTANNPTELQLLYTIAALLDRIGAQK